MRALSTAPMGARMNNPTNRSRNAIDDRAAAKWWQFPADVYLDHRRLSWVLVEELGDVRFLPAAGGACCWPRPRVAVPVGRHQG
jgi:hypothetical protein